MEQEASTSSQHTPIPRKNRKINRSLPQLKRNAACVPCRRRRVKCDGARPVCSSCIRSFQFLVRTQPEPQRDALGVQCFYEEEDDGEQSPPVKRKAQEMYEEVDPRVTVSQLEAKVAALQNALLIATGEHVRGPTMDENAQNGYNNLVPAPVPTLNTAWMQQNHPPLVPPESMDPNPPQLQPLPPAEETQPVDAETGALAGPFAEIFWPGWPQRLPTPSMLDHLVFTFFNSISSASRLIHRQSFMARLALPPQHPDFPHVALLHAICAVSARYSAAVKVCSVQELVEKSLMNTPAEFGPGRMTLDEEASQEKCFAERHWRYCQLEIRYDNCKGTKLFEVLQAQVILLQYICQTAKWLDGWILLGSITRSAIALGLLDETEQPSADGMRLKHSILPPPKSSIEREERRALAGEVIAGDAAFSASGSWPGTLPALDEMYFRLPASKASFTNMNMEIPENPQWFGSIDMLSNHPVEDSYVLYIKASMLLSSVSKYARGLRKRPVAERTRDAVDFIALDTKLKNFSESFPAYLRDPLQPCPGYSNRIDTDLINAHLIHRVAAILLHEPYADLGNVDCSSSTRILVEAKACLGVLFLVLSTATDMALMLYPITSVWLYHAVRILVLFYHRALEMQDTPTSQTLLSEIEVFQMAFAAMGNRFATGAVHCGMIDVMVRRIREEFGLPEQNWHWSPRDWVGNPKSSSALNYQAGMRSTNPKLPLLPATHPDGMAWGDEDRRLTYRQIFDQQRAFVGRSPRAPYSLLHGQTTSDAGTYPIPTLASVSPMGSGSTPSLSGQNSSRI